jgi:hypothetical protein
VTPSAHEGVPLERYAGGIIEIAGISRFLQIACSAAFEALMADPAAELDWRHGARRIHGGGEAALPVHLGPLRTKPHGKPQHTGRRQGIGAKFSYVKEDLVRRGYIVESDKSAALCSTSFKEFVTEQTGKSGPRRRAAITVQKGN